MPKQTREEFIAWVEEHGRKDCDNPTCTRMGYGLNPADPMAGSVCVGMHCAYCDGPCGPQGHDCPERRAANGGV